jgi:hypothetical protein
MTRHFVMALALVVCASCATETAEPKPDAWSLALADPGYTEVYLGGYGSLESCQDAGRSWSSRAHDKAYLLECRLNCSKLAPGDASTCEQAEPVQ